MADDSHRGVILLSCSSMTGKKVGVVLAGGYLILAASAIAYELGIRIYDTGNSEFAGMLSFALTLPSSLLIAWLSRAIFGVAVGDSNASFVAILGLAARVNTCGVACIAINRRK